MSTTPLQRNYLEELRAIIFSEFAALSWARLPEHLQDLDLVWQAPRESDSKPRYVKRSLKETPDDEIIRVARWYVGNHSSTDEIEDLLEWLKSKGKQTLSDITRREVLEAVDGRHLAGRVEIQELMNLAGASLPRYGGFRSVVQDGSGLYTEDISYAFYGQSSPRAPLSNKQFLKDCGFLAWVDSRAVRLLVALVHPSVREEIDGRQHYADDSGKASSERYAEMVRADRSLRLSGYEVYRFGGHDFANKGAEQMIIDFFRRLFARHGIA